MIAGVLLVVSIATMAGRGTEPARADAQALPSITIPVIYSATGPAGGFGKLARVGFDLAVSQVNAQGGIRGRRLKLRYTDDGTDPIRAVRLTDDAVNTKAPVVIGPILSASATAALPRCVQAKVACIATITGNAPAIRDAAPWGFSFIQPGDLIAKKGTNLFLKARKPQRFGQIIDKVNPSMVLQAQGFVQAATTARITLLDPQGTSFKPRALRAMASTGMPSSGRPIRRSRDG
jgi:ABC-type branched-subunit amino acid transport system substrate-binding protein